MCLDRLGDRVESNLQPGGTQMVGAEAAGRREGDRGLAASAGSGVSCPPGLGAAALGKRMRRIPRRFAGRLLSKGGGARCGCTLGARRAFFKGVIINCSRGLHSTSGRRKATAGLPGTHPRAMPAVCSPPEARTPNPWRPRLGADPHLHTPPPPGPSRPAEASSSRPTPRAQLFGAVWALRGRGGRPGAREGSHSGAGGTGAAGNGMLTRAAALSGAPTGPARGEGG